jgi:UDP-N-acetylglucosamine--N-acetylmuramyl-(pentapeptide) pyrophosphoryl-undecaprenol N-acetylglucosamine transferase
VTTLLVASTGGHLKELHHLRSRIEGVEGPFRWVTFDTPQSRSMLGGEQVDFVPFVGSRDPLNLVRTGGVARRILRAHRVESVVSTGSSVALPFLGLSRARGHRCHYIESAARLDGPSLTGRLMSGIPGVHLYTQHGDWAGRRWKFRGSVYDSFAAEPLPGAAAPIEKVVVTLGTWRGYDFSRLVRRLLKVIPADAEVLWQVGDTDVAALGIEGIDTMPEAELTAAMREADVVIAHAGVGTTLAAFEVGRCPVLVPRRLAFGEHVDDHQSQIASQLAERGLAISVEADAVEHEHLVAASRRRVTQPADAPRFAALRRLDA